MGGEQGRAGSAGLGGSRGHAGSGGDPSSLNGAGKKAGEKGKDGQKGDRGKSGQEGKAGEPGSKSGQSGVKKFVIVDSKTGQVLEQASEMYDLVVSDFELKTTDVNTNDGIIEPGEAVMITYLKIKNEGKLTCPSGVVISFTSLASSKFKFLPSAGQESFTLNTSLAPQEEIVVPHDFHGIVGENGSSGLESEITIISQATLLGKTFNNSTLPKTFKVQYPVSIESISQDPTALRPGKAATLKITLNNASGIPYGKYTPNPVHYVITFDTRFVTKTFEVQLIPENGKYEKSIPIELEQAGDGKDVLITTNLYLRGNLIETVETKIPLAETNDSSSGERFCAKCLDDEEQTQATHFCKTCALHFCEEHLTLHNKANKTKFHVDDLVELKKESSVPHCTKCFDEAEEKTNATHHCSDCDAYFCELHLTLHNKSNKTKFHTGLKELPPPNSTKSSALAQPVFKRKTFSLFGKIEYVGKLGDKYGNYSRHQRDPGLFSLPHDVKINAMTRQAFVSDYLNGRIQVFDCATKKYLYHFSVPGGSRSIAFDYNDKTLLVSGTSTNKV